MTTATVSDSGRRAAALQLMQQVHAEYTEMPGMSLTLAQAQRLWAIDHATCEDALDRLTAAGVLRRTATGRYVRASTESARNRSALDAAIVIALIGFLGTVAYATYVERGDPQ